MSSYEFSLKLSSDPRTGANTTLNGSTMSIILQPPIDLPEGKRWSVGVQSASFWNTFPNVSVELSNTHFRFLDNQTATSYELVLSKGLYDVSAIESRINDLLILNGLPDGIFVFEPDFATNKVTLKINRIGVTIYFSDANSVGKLMGFTSDIGPTTAVGFVYESDSQANVNNTTEILVNLSIASSYFNGIGGTNVIAGVVPNVEVGRQILYQPNVIPKSPVIGQHHDKIELWLTNAADGNRLDTNGESFTVMLIFYIEDII